MMAQFHFLRPWWLAALPLIFLLGWWYQRKSAHGGAWGGLIDPVLLPFVVRSGAAGPFALRAALLVTAGLCCVLALAGPTWERLPTPVFRQQSALVIALDLSASMNAEDVKPSRLARAKFAIRDLLEQRADGQTALVVFAAQSFVVTPLTEDRETILAQLQGLDTLIMPRQGSEPATALESAADLLEQAGVRDGDILIVTDGARGDALARARSAAGKYALRVSVLAVGTGEGAPIPDRDGGFIKRGDGELVLSKVDPERLKDLAASSGGRFALNAATGNQGLLLAGWFERAEQTRSAERDLTSAQWREMGPWLVLPVVLLAAYGFRRGVLVGLLVSIGLAAPPVRAGWWLTDDQAAARAFAEGAYGDAAEQFRDRAWRGAAHYRAGDYAAALADYAEAGDAEAHYNRGNALARLGRYEEAIAAYDRALEQVPAHGDAQYNKSLLEDLLQQQTPPDTSNQEKSGEDRSDDSDADSNADSQTGGGASAGEQQQRQEAEGDARSGGQQGEDQSAAQGARERAPEPETADDDSPQPEKDATPAESPEQGAQNAMAATEADAERAQATDQWLRQIPDDPAGLLRRKFEYLYKKRYGDVPYTGDQW